MLHGQLWVGKGDVVLSVKGLGTSEGPHGLVNPTARSFKESTNC